MSTFNLINYLGLFFSLTPGHTNGDPCKFKGRDLYVQFRPMEEVTTRNLKPSLKANDQMWEKLGGGRDIFFVIAISLTS